MASVCGIAHRTAIEDHTVNGTLKQAAVERFFRFAFRKEVLVSNLHAVGKFPGQGIQELPERRQVARSKRGRKLQPVLADAVCQKRHPAKEFVGQLTAVSQRGLVRNGRRKLEAEAEVVGRLFPPARNNLGFRERIEASVTLDAVNMSGVRG